MIWIPVWDKEKEKYDVNKTDIYFRYGVHSGTYDREFEGFYIEKDGPYWGTDLNDVKGVRFWKEVKVITDWVVNYLPEYIENMDKSRGQRLEQLEKIVEGLRQIREE